MVSIRLTLVVAVLGTSSCTGLGPAQPAPESRYEVDEGGALVVQPGRGLLAGAGEGAFAVLATGPKHASRFSLSPDGAFRYVHDGTETATDSFVYTVRDGSGSSYPQRARIDIRLTNDAPIAADLSLAAVGGRAVSGRVPASDPDGGELRYQAQEPQGGRVRLSGRTGEFTYEPRPGFEGSDRFRVTVDDGRGGRADAYVAIDVAGAGPGRGEEPARDNRPPQVADLQLKTMAGRPAQAPVPATDPEGAALGYSIEAPQHGVARVRAGRLEYMPVPDFAGEDRFLVTVTDPRGAVAEFSVFVEVTAVDEPPRAPAAADAR